MIGSNLVYRPNGLRVAAALFITAALSLPVTTSHVDARTVTGNIVSITPEDITGSCPAGATLQVEKQKHRPYQNAASQDIPPGVISGITFEALRVEGVDTTTTAGWQQAQGITVEQAGGMNLSGPFTAVTDVAGIARFSGTLPVGLYLIREVIPSSPHPNYRQSAPFLATLPVGNATGDAWQCDVVIKTKEKPEKPPVTTTTTTPPATTKPPTPTTTTTTPTPTTTPVTPGTPPTQTPPRTPLASTGASVLGIVLAALGLMTVGGLLLYRRRSLRRD